MAGPEPLYGTWMKLPCVFSLNSSPAMCGVVPIPAEAKLRPWPPALAMPCSSATLLAGKLLVTESISGERVSMDTAVKSFRAS